MVVILWAELRMLALLRLLGCQVECASPVEVGVEIFGPHLGAGLLAVVRVLVRMQLELARRVQLLGH